MDYEFDVVLPSVEQDDSQSVPNMSTNISTDLSNSLDRQHLQPSADTPLSLSSPAKTPQKTPKSQRNGSSPQRPVPSPSRALSTSSPLNPDRRSSTPLLHNKKSLTGLKKSEAPLRQTPSRQSSYNLASSSPDATMQHYHGMVPQNVEKKPLATASSVARSFFQKEMEFHESADCASKTVILIHDSCYGHRYSRPRTSKGVLSTIVERPERLHASILGLSAAYVRMGRRHAEGLAPPHPDRDPRLAGAVPFQIRKTSRSVSLNSAAATHVHGQKWMEELQMMCESAEGKLALNGKELVRPIGYGKDESGNLLPKLHEGDLYLCSESLNALEGCLGGVCDAVDAVFGSEHTRRAFVCIRPPGHHCSSDYPSGFCWINNVHVGITHAAIHHGLTHAAIIDFDLHHGDGSQMVAWEHNRKALNLPKNAAPYKKTPVGYFSLHDINSYPCEMGDEEKVRNASLCIENAHGQSIWNVHLEPWKTHADFWRLYESKYAVLIDKARSFLRYHAEKQNSSTSGLKAKAAIFLSAGFDASEWEGEGMQRHKVNVPTDFYARFTADVVRLAEEEGLGVDGRVISVLEGGYSDRALTSGVLSHVCGLTQDTGNYNSPERVQEHGLSAEMRAKLGITGMDEQASAIDRLRADYKSQLDAEWWNLANLQSLEALVNPTTGQPATTKTKDKPPGNYSSPTQASTAKMTDQARYRRSLSGQLERVASLEPEPVPPPPEVDWATAAYELSRVIIPAERQTLSCRYDELNPDATRVRRERQSTVGLPTNGEQRMQLRDRKAKASPDEEVSKGANRRKTIAAVGNLPDPHPDQADSQMDASNAARPRRRSSGASSVLTGMQNMQISEPASRASSVVSEKPKKVVAAKKPRTATVPRVQPAKNRTTPTRANQTTLPIPEVPSAVAVHHENSTEVGPSVPEVVTDETQPSQARSGSVSRVSMADELDGISAGVKKMSIKLKLPSPEENAEREKKTAEAKAKKPRQKKPAVPKDPKSATVGTNKTTATTVKPIAKRDKNSAVSNDVPTSMTQARASGPPALMTSSQQSGHARVDATNPDQPSLALEQISASTQNEEGVHDIAKHAVEISRPEVAQEVAIARLDPPNIRSVAYEKQAGGQPEPYAEPTRPGDHPSTTANARPNLGNEIPLRAETTTNIDKEGKAALGSMTSPKTVQSSTPVSAKRTKEDLPVFTSSSPIPFGRSFLGNLNENLQTPTIRDASHKRLGDALEQATTNVPSEDPAKSGQTGAGGQQKVESDASEVSGPSRASEASIWDVPETPQR